MKGGCFTVFACSKTHICLYSFTHTSFSTIVDAEGDWVVQWFWVNFQGWGIILIWITVRQEPAALAADAGWGGGGGC